MKNYLEVFVGSRGILEGVEMKGFENIEEWLEEESKENKKWLEEEEFESDEDREEIEGYWNWGKDLNEDYFLGLGDEEVKIYVDVECERFINWKNRNKIGDDVDWNKIEDEIMRDLID